MDFTENDLREIERSRELPPDELYGEEGEAEDEACPHTATRLRRIYQERREVCLDCGKTLQTVTVPYGAWFCIHGHFNAEGCLECEGERRLNDTLR